MEWSSLAHGGKVVIRLKTQLAFAKHLCCFVSLCLAMLMATDRMGRCSGDFGVGGLRWATLGCCICPSPSWAD